MKSTLENIASDISNTIEGYILRDVDLLRLWQQTDIEQRLKIRIEVRELIVERLKVYV